MDLLLQVSEKELEEFPEPQMITQIKISLIEPTQVELRAAIVHISYRLRLRLVQLQKLLRYQQLHCMAVKNVGIGNWQHDQLPCTHSHIGKGNMTSHVPIFLHC